jgi:hypothetical protein
MSKVKRIKLSDRVFYEVMAARNGNEFKVIESVENIVKFISNNYRRRQYGKFKRYYCNTCNHWHKQMQLCDKKGLIYT